MNYNFNANKSHFLVYLVGIGGISMSALATYLKKTGFAVSGYDNKLSVITDQLEGLGISINDTNDLINCDIAVVSSAINENDPIIKKLKSLNKAIISRARLLSEIASTYPLTIGVAGTHGKTTTTAMIAHVLKQAKSRFCAHVGGFDKHFGNLAYFGDQIFLSEVCEYKRNVNLFSPTIGVLLNVSDDHLESYGRFSVLEETFSCYLQRSERAVVLYEQRKYAQNAITFSLDNANANYYASQIVLNKDSVECLVNEHSEPLFHLKLNCLHLHDVQNAMACVAVCKALEIDNQSIKIGLENFEGVKRRNEILKVVNNATIFADYAHHPEQIEDTVNFLKRRYKKFAVLFQSHTYSRTANLFSKFINSLKEIENLFIFDTYGAREKYEYKGSGKRLAESLGGCVYCGQVENVKNLLPAIVEKFECVAVLGAGDLYDFVCESIFEKQ